MLLILNRLFMGTQKKNFNLNTQNTQFSLGFKPNATLEPHIIHWRLVFFFSPAIPNYSLPLFPFPMVMSNNLYLLKSAI